MTATSEYSYSGRDFSHTHVYLMPTVERLLSESRDEASIFELGCGNGANAAYLSSKGFAISGVDPSTSGIAIAQQNYPYCRLEVGSADDPLAERFGKFDIVLSLEVIEHVYSPARFVTAIHELLNPGGFAIISTPYHGYAKNLTLALSGRLDAHFTALWEGGHIKFWSRKTLTQLFVERGFQLASFHRVGRLPMLAKSMVAMYRKL